MLISDILFPETKNIEMKNEHNINKYDTCMFKRKIPDTVLITKFKEIIIISKKATSLKKRLYNWDDKNKSKTNMKNAGDR